MRETPQEKLLAPLKDFAERLTAKFSAKSVGEPEDQLKSPVDQLFAAYGSIISRNIVLKGESTLSDRLGRPDFAAHANDLPIGYIELKAPGKGANPAHFKGHDKEQWMRFKNVPNLIYTDGNEWALYQSREHKEPRKSKELQQPLLVRRVRLMGDATSDGAKAITEDNARDLFQLFADFTSWSPIIPKKPKELAAFLAPFCRLLREEVLDALKVETSPMHSLRAEIQALLFPDASEAQFADAYAETVTFALLLAQMEGANVLDLQNSYNTLEHHHALLSRSLQFLTDKEARKEIDSSLSMAQRVIHEIPPELLKSSDAAKDPWLFFYEDFLAAYDPKLRKQSGVYFTPLEVVNCQVRLIDEILNKHLGREMGFVEPGVATLDPATGTGTYLLAIVEHALSRVDKEEGAGAVKGGARALVNNLHGFEWMVGPYAVAQLRFTQAIVKRGVSLPDFNPGIYLTNTLESPFTKPSVQPLFHKIIANEHLSALSVKEDKRVLVCLGNPPYGRHEATSEGNHAITGGWVRYGDTKNDADALPIIEAFLEPARKAGYGVHLKNLYNLYVYFIRWSLWKVFEHKTATGPGIVSFITASSYLDGDAFVGLREHMRRVCDFIDIIDLGGEGRGTRQDENVFAIQTPVAIFVAWRKDKPDKDKPARVRYTRIEGTRDEKLAALDAVKSDKGLKWETVPDEWQTPFRPAATHKYSKWPEITDLFPWQSNGVQCKRTWPIAPSAEVLEHRWKALLKSDDRALAMKDTGDRNVSLPQVDIFDNNVTLPAIEKLPVNSRPHKIVRYAYRSFDRQYLLADNRLISRPRPPLWPTHSERQIYLSSLLTKPIGNGPALTACAHIPDLDHFSNRGAKDNIPLYRDTDCTAPNTLLGLLDMLSKAYGSKITPEDFAGYVYGILAQPEYTRRFADELGSKEVRVPLTKDGKLFGKVAELGRGLIWLHTYGERLDDKGHPKGRVPNGKAKCVKEISTHKVSDDEYYYPNEYSYNDVTKTIHVGDGKFSPVSSDVWEFEVSGLKVVQSWLGYRMKDRKGKKSSPLDDIRPKIWTHDFMRELLELLWVLEHTVKGYPKQKELLEAVLESELFMAEALPPVPDESRKPPKVEKHDTQEDINYQGAL